jgi:hypothetical protein
LRREHVQPGLRYAVHVRGTAGMTKTAAPGAWERPKHAQRKGD